ncbi:MAG: HEAT repeat domain-containing protein, partial [Planctomycetota bacterium]
RVIAARSIGPDEVSVALRRAIAENVRSDVPDWLLLAGAVHDREQRPALERALDSPVPAVRHAAAVGLELLGDKEAVPALRRALSGARSRGDRVLLERALEALR